MQLMRRSVPGTTLVLSLSMLVSAPPVLAQQVIESSFCSKIAGRDCVRRYLDQEEVPIGDLDVDDQKRPTLYFQSVVAVEQGDVFVHAWERENATRKAGAPATVYSKQSLADETRKVLESARIGKLGDPLHVVIKATASSPTYRAVSSQPVRAPGKFVAEVFGGRGELLPGSRLHEIEIIP